MLTTKVKKKIIFLSLFCLILIILALFVFKNLNQNLLYFKTPTEIFNDNNLDYNRSIRLGGMVKKDSIDVSKNEIRFIITDFEKEILVSFNGTVPNLFSEGKGVIAEGKLKDKKYFVAKRILAKHDENYMPPSMKEMIKKNAK
tara:strand:- start:542 stop:970 length:429 start_codon:yes stop_codon:yes gene_type:complete